MVIMVRVVLVAFGVIFGMVALLSIGVLAVSLRYLVEQALLVQDDARSTSSTRSRSVRASS